MTLTKTPDICFLFDFFLIKKEILRVEDRKEEGKIRNKEKMQKKCKIKIAIYCLIRKH